MRLSLRGEERFACVTCCPLTTRLASSAATSVIMQSPGPARAAADGMPADVDDMVGMFQEDDGPVQGEDEAELVQGRIDAKPPC